MRLAVALDLVGEVLEAPGFGLGDLALSGFNDLGGGGGQRINLRLAKVLASQEHVLIESHGISFHHSTDRWLIRTIAGPLRLSSLPLSREVAAFSRSGAKSKREVRD